jgi:5-methylcytosine-specific restriction enzyme A
MNGKIITEMPKQCRWCKSEVKPPRRNWCSQKCVEEYQDLNDWNWILQKVFKRDAGVCADCGCDTQKLLRVLRHAFGYKIRSFEIQMGFNEGKSYWECDHILERVRGGTNETSNLQTLCVPCHKRKTARLAAERALERKAAKLVANEAAAMPLFANRMNGG